MTKRIQWARFRTAGVLMLVLAALLGAVEAWTAVGTRTVLVRMARVATGVESATVEAATIRGSRLTSLRVTDLRVRVGTSDDVATVESLALHYRFWPLLRRSLVLDRVEVSGVRLDLRECATGWYRNKYPTPTDSTAPAWSVSLDDMSVEGGAARGGECVDSTTWSVEGLRASIAGVRTLPRVEGRVSDLHMQIRPSGMPPDYSASLSLTAAFKAGVLSVDSLSIRSPRSEVLASGVLRALTAPTGSADIDFDVHADPLAFADIEPFLPSLVPDGSVRLEAGLTTSGDLLRVVGFAEILGGGRADVDATLAETLSDDLRYVGTVTVDSLDPAALVIDAAAGLVDGVADFDLEGPTLDLLAGTVTISGIGAFSGSDVASELRLDATLAEGLAEVSGMVEVDRATGSVEGWVRPFAQARTGELKGNFAWATPNSAPNPARVAGDYEVTFSFEDWRRASGAGAVRLRASSMGSASIPDASLSVQLDEGAGGWLADATVGLGGVDARGLLDLSEDPRFSVEHAEIRELDLASLFGLPTASAVNGTLNATRTRGDSGLGDWTGEAVLDQTSFGSLVAESTSIDFVLEGSRLGVDIRAAAFTGSAMARIEGTIDEEMRLDLTSSRFDGFDLLASLGFGDGSSSLSGRATGFWSAQQRPSRLSISLARDSRLRRMQLDTGTVNLRLSGDSAAVDASLRADSGQLLIRASRSGAAELATWRLHEARFENLDLAALGETDDTPARLTGRLTGSWQGTVIASSTGEARLELDRSELGLLLVETATLDATVGNGRSNLVGTVAADLVSGDFEAAVDLPSEGAVSSGTGQFRGEVQGVAIDSAYAAASYDSSSLAVDTFQVWSAAVLAGGRMGLLREPTRVTDFSVTAALLDAAPLRSWFGLAVDTLTRADLVASGDAVGDSLEFSGRVTGVGLFTGTMHAEAFTGSGRGFRDAAGSLTQVEAEGEANAVRAGRLSVERARMGVTPDGEDMVVTVDVFVDEEREFNGVIAARPTDAGTNVVVRELTIDLANQGWDLDGTPSLHIAKGVMVEDLTLVSRSGTGRITAEGAIREAGAQSLNVRVEGLELAGLSDVIGYDGLRGVVGGSLALAGTARAPTIAGSVEARGTLRGSDPAELTLEIVYDDQLFSVDGSLELGAGQTARLSGELPVDMTLTPVDSTETRVTLLTDRAIDVELTASQLGLQWLAPWLVNEGVRELTGVVDADLRATGTPSDPSLRGGFEARSAAASLPIVGLRLRDGLLRGHFEQSRLLIDEFQVVSGGGRMAGNGSVVIDGAVPGAIDFVVSLDDFLAVRSDVFRAVTDGDLTVRGTAAEPIVAGSVDVLSANVFLGGRFAGAPAEVVELTAEDYATLAARFGYRPPTESPLTRTTGAGPLALDVQVRMGRDTWVRQRANPALSVQFTGDVRVEKARNELERVFGRLEAVPRGSYVEQFGRRFAITSGTVDFNGLLPELRLDVAAEYRVPARGDPTASEVVIGLGVVGGLNDLGLILSSRPEMENADIVSYLATGRPASQSMQFGSSGSGQLVERGTTMALGRATSAVERLASESIGLDVMQIRSEGSRGVTVVAGRYVSPRLYLGFKQPIGFRRSDSSANTRTRSPEVEIEYQALRWLLLNLQREGSRIDFFLRSRYAY